MKKNLEVTKKAVEIITYFSDRNEVGLLNTFLSDFKLKFYGEFDTRRVKSTERALLLAHFKQFVLDKGIILPRLKTSIVI